MNPTHQIEPPSEESSQVAIDVTLISEAVKRWCPEMDESKRACVESAFGAIIDECRVVPVDPLIDFRRVLDASGAADRDERT